MTKYDVIVVFRRMIIENSFNHTFTIIFFFYHMTRILGKERFEDDYLTYILKNVVIRKNHFDTNYFFIWKNLVNSVLLVLCFICIHKYQHLSGYMGRPITDSPQNNSFKTRGHRDNARSNGRRLDLYLLMHKQLSQSFVSVFCHRQYKYIIVEMWR